MTPEQHAATALVEALAALRKAATAVEVALAIVEGKTPPRDIRASAAIRTTSVQILSVLSGSPQALTLQDIADEIVAIRRSEDEPRRGGGTRYQEICRNAIRRLIEQGLVARVPPQIKSERMRFRRTMVGQSA